MLKGTVPIMVIAFWIAASTLTAYESLQGPTELLHWDKERACNGYTLFSARGSYLIEMEGRVINTWPIGTTPRLLPNGHLLDATKDDPSGFGGFRELDWEGNVVWAYDEERPGYAPHHDWVRIFNKKLNMVRPNGLIGTPDGKTLYVTDAGARETYRYAIQDDGMLSNKTPFVPVGSDGMTIDSNGNVYLTENGVLFVFANPILAGTAFSQDAGRPGDLQRREQGQRRGGGQGDRARGDQQRAGQGQRGEGQGDRARGDQQSAGQGQRGRGQGGDRGGSGISRLALLRISAVQKELELVEFQIDAVIQPEGRRPGRLQTRGKPNVRVQQMAGPLALDYRPSSFDPARWAGLGKPAGRWPCFSCLTQMWKLFLSRP